MCCLKLFVRLYLTYTYILGNFSVTSKADVSEPSSIIAKLKVGMKLLVNTSNFCQTLTLHSQHLPLISFKTIKENLMLSKEVTPFWLRKCQINEQMQFNHPREFNII